MIITQPLHSFAKLSRLKCRHTMLYKLQCQSNHGENRARTPRVALEYEFHLSCFTHLANQAQYERGKTCDQQQHTSKRFLCVERLAENPNPKRSLFKSRNDSSICIRWAYTATTASALKCARPGHTANNHGSRCARAFFKPRLERYPLTRAALLVALFGSHV